jgi:hypothetical protein
MPIFLLPKRYADAGSDALVVPANGAAKEEPQSFRETRQRVRSTVDSAVRRRKVIGSAFSRTWSSEPQGKVNYQYRENTTGRPSKPR